MIRYTEDFKEKVRGIFGKSLNDFLERNSEALLKVLEIQAQGPTPDFILRARTLKELKAEAKRSKDIEALIKAWYEQPRD